MAKQMERASLQRYARMGAATRLEELELERVAILKAFPELEGSRRGTGAAHARQSVPARRRRRGRMSAAARKAASVRMKKYWAQRRQHKGAAAAKS